MSRGLQAQLPAEGLDALWNKYCHTLPNCTYRDSIVTEVWNSFSRLLDAAPLIDPSASTAANGATPSTGAGTGVSGPNRSGFDSRRQSNLASSAVGGICRARILVFELSWVCMTVEQQSVLRDTPTTTLPMLVFLRAVISSRRTLAAVDRVDLDQLQPLPPNPDGALVDLVEHSTLCVSLLGGPVTPLQDIGANSIGRFLFVHGTVIRLSSPKLRCVVMPFRCTLCSHVVHVPLEGSTLSYPTLCKGKCRGFFTPMEDEAITEEVQVLKIQEQQIASHRDGRHDGSSSSGAAAAAAAMASGAGPAGSEMNKVIEVELRTFLLDAVAAGDTVTVGGVVVARRADKSAGGMRYLCIEAQSVVVEANTGGGGLSRRAGQSGARKGGLAGSAASFPYEKVARFHELARREDWFAHLVSSFAPGIVGMAHVKAALLLAIAGGTARPHRRSQIHVLMIGDPGLGKSQLLRAAAAVAPRSSLATANTSSACGLTITLSRDPQNGETTFEAGAVIHGDGGVTCIDEIDKGVQEHKALLEVMEQGTISMAKAGALFTMPVSTSILAAGNPTTGKFDFLQPLANNVNLSGPLLSRFDVIFLLSDHDRMSAARTQNLGEVTSIDLAQSQDHLRGKGAVGYTAVAAHVLGMHSVSGSGGGPHGSAAAAARQQLLGGDTISEFLLFAKESCHPVLTPSAAAVLKDAYLREREAQAKEGGGLDLPVTPRQLQALIRLAEAKAKLDLRPQVTEEDAKFVLGLLASAGRSYREGWQRGPGSLTLRGAVSGEGPPRGLGKLPAPDVAIANMVRLATETGNESLSYADALMCCSDTASKNPKKLLDDLNEQGRILLKGGKYQVRKGC